MTVAISDFKVCPVDGDVLGRLNEIAREAENAAHGLPVIEAYESIAPIESAWRQLEAEPFVSLHQSLAWCQAWITAFQPELAIVCGKSEGRIVFILPLEIIKTPPGRIARFIGAPHSNINTGVFSRDFAEKMAPGHIGEIEAQIRKALRKRADLVHLTKMPAFWQGVQMPFATAHVIENQNHAFQLPLLDTFDETLKQINAKRKKKKMRTGVKRLEAMGGFDHVIAETSEAAEEILEEFFHQKAIRFREAGITNVFKDKEIQTFFKKAATSSLTGENYILRLHAIRLKTVGQPIAAIASLSRKDNHVICQFGSINETLAADASPGELLFYLMIEELIRQDVAIFDFGIGDQAYKRSWCPVETIQYDAILPTNLRGQMIALLVRSNTRLKSAIKKNRQLYSLLQKLRKITSSGKH